MDSQPTVAAAPTPVNHDGPEVVKVSAETGSRRFVLFTVREKSMCRVCGEPILRVTDAQTDIWLHEKRIQGLPIDHPARPERSKR